MVNQRLKIQRTEATVSGNMKQLLLVDTMLAHLRITPSILLGLSNSLLSCIHPGGEEKCGVTFFKGNNIEELQRKKCAKQNIFAEEPLAFC